MFIFTLCRCFSWKSTRKSSTLTYLFCWFCSIEYLWKACIKYLYQDYHLHHMGLFCQVFSYGGKNIHKRSLESCSNPCLSSSKISVSRFARVVNERATLRVLRVLALSTVFSNLLRQILIIFIIDVGLYIWLVLYI